MLNKEKFKDEGGRRMYEVKTYYCDGIPTDKDLERAVDATWIYNCIVELKWFYYGEYSILIKPGEKWEDVKANKMPHGYWLFRKENNYGE